MGNVRAEDLQQGSAEVFISYSSQDRERITQIADELEGGGIHVWLDRNKIPGASNYGLEIVRGIKSCKVFMLMCSNASMRSRNVKAEIQLAWKYERPYLPILLEEISYPEQLQYWLEGYQWIEVMNFPNERWLPRVIHSLRLAGVAGQDLPLSSGQAECSVKAIQWSKGLKSLRSIAKFTDQIWPVPALSADRGPVGTARGLGAPQDSVQHGFPLGSRVRLALESDREGHLLLLDEGPEEIVYCLCPSLFAPETRIRQGRTYLPQKGSPHDSFVVTGKPGREHLLAIITDDPLDLDWMPKEPRIPARVLHPGEIGTLLAMLQGLEGNRWVALSTYFDVLL